MKDLLKENHKDIFEEQKPRVSDPEIEGIPAQKKNVDKTSKIRNNKSKYIIY